MRRLLAPRWLARHVLLVVIVAACLRLGWWQWQRGNSSGGTIQNLGYAVEWPVFAGVAVFMWWKAFQLEGRPEGASRGADTLPTGPALPQTRPLDHRAPFADRSALAVAGTTGGDEADADDPDEELVAYNQMLARLAANPRR